MFEDRYKSTLCIFDGHACDSEYGNGVTTDKKYKLVGNYD